jgi:hypothetical protein
MFREFEWRGDDAATSSGSESGGVRVKMEPAAEEAALVRAAAKDEKDAGADMHWADAIKLLQAGQLNPRPSHIMDEDSHTQQVFLEHPLLKRRKGDDRWMTSGGRKGALERWASPEVGVLKRYGRVVRPNKTPLKYAQYSLQIRRRGREFQPETVDIKDKSLWVVQPVYHSDAAQTVFSASSGSVNQAAVDIRTAKRKFLSFQSTVPSEAGIELGAIVRQGAGVKLESTQGDFAEWHRRADGEAPFEEGDVVGFRRGRIGRKTRGCDILGVVSRKAVVEGSAPPMAERHLYDSVAYCGIVPVKLSAQRTAADLACDCPAPLAGQLLTPSGCNDGTAVLVPSNETTSRVGILLDDSELAEPDPEDARTAQAGGYTLVTALVVAPSETVRAASRQRTQLLRRLALLLLWFLVTTSVALFLLRRLEMLPFQADDQLGPNVSAMDEISHQCPVEVRKCLDTDGCPAQLNLALLNHDGISHYGQGSKEVQDIVKCVGCGHGVSQKSIDQWGCPTNVCDVSELWAMMPPGYLTHVDWDPGDSLPESGGLFVTVQDLHLLCHRELGYHGDEGFWPEGEEPRPVMAACREDHGNFSTLVGCVKGPLPPNAGGGGEGRQVHAYTTTMAELIAKCPLQVQTCSSTAGCLSLLENARGNHGGMQAYVRKTVFLSHLYINATFFTKTGSGQT